MDLNNKNIYIPLIAVSLSLIVIWIIFQAEFIKLLSEIASFGTLIVAIYAVKEYRSKVVNKVNEEQLKKVLELLEYMQKCEYKGNFHIYQKNIHKNPIHIVKEEISLLEICENYNPLFLEYLEYQDFINRPMDVNYSYLFVSEKFIKDLIKLSKYCNNPLIPKEIAQKLKILSGLNIEGLNIAKNQYKTEINHFNNSVVVKQEDNSESKYTLGEYIILDKDDYALTIYCKLQNKEITSVIDYWSDFRKYLKDLVKAIKNWLHNNNVKGVNLPDLD